MQRPSLTRHAPGVIHYIDCHRIVCQQIGQNGLDWIRRGDSIPVPTATRNGSQQQKQQQRQQNPPWPPAAGARVVHVISQPMLRRGHKYLISREPRLQLPARSRNGTTSDREQRSRLKHSCVPTFVNRQNQNLQDFMIWQDWGNCSELRASVIASEAWQSRWRKGILRGGRC